MMAPRLQLHLLQHAPCSSRALGHAPWAEDVTLAPATRARRRQLRLACPPRALRQSRLRGRAAPPILRQPPDLLAHASWLTGCTALVPFHNSSAVACCPHVQCRRCIRMGRTYIRYRRSSAGRLIITRGGAPATRAARCVPFAPASGSRCGEGARQSVAGDRGHWNADAQARTHLRHSEQLVLQRLRDEEESGHAAVPTHRDHAPRAPSAGPGAWAHRAARTCTSPRP